MNWPLVASMALCVMAWTAMVLSWLRYRKARRRYEASADALFSLPPVELPSGTVDVSRLGEPFEVRLELATRAFYYRRASSRYCGYTGDLMTLMGLWHDGVPPSWGEG